MAKRKKIDYHNVLVEISRDLKEWKYKLKLTLDEFGIDVQDKSFKELLDLITQLDVMKKGKRYSGLTKDKNGYIIGLFDINEFIEKSELPKDISYGYYKINKDGEFIIDYERKRQIEEV